MTAHDLDDTQALLREGAWIRRLSEQLVRDPAAADDAAQEAWLAWVRRRPPGAGRRWLATVIRNRVRQHHRADGRRTRHETVASRTDATPSAAELAARLEIQRRVVEAVQALDEPYRSTLALRFLEELPPREIARRTTTPVDTVRTHIERGLARLRAELDASAGGRQRWLGVLTPIVPLSKSSASVGVGTLAMSSGIKIVGPVVGLLLVGLFIGRPWATEEPAPADLAQRETAGVEPLDDLPARSPESGARSLAANAEVDDEPASSSVETPTARPTFVGSVVDLDGRAVGGIRVEFVATTHVLTEPPAGERWTETREDGTFTMTVWEERGRILAQGGGLATIVDAGLGGVVPVEPPVLVVAPHQTHTGRVVDEAGAPIAGAELELQIPASVVSRWNPGTLAGLRSAAASAVTDEDGSFVLRDVGVAPGTGLRVRAAGYRFVTHDLPPDSRDDWWIELAAEEAGPNERSGVVVDADGVAVEGAYVHAGDETVTTDGAGAFRVPVREGAEVLRAAAAGRLPVEVRLDALPLDEIVVTLGREPLRISGRVLDAAGAPVEDALVWTYDGSRFGNVLEEIGGIRFAVTKDMEQLTVAGSKDGRQVRSDARGRFELTGLLESSYTVQALHPVTLVHVTQEVTTGNEIELVLPGAGAVETVAGRVETWDGEPLAGVSVAIQRPVPTRYGSQLGRNRLDDERPVTGADGRFRLQGHHARELWLRVEGAVIGTGVTVELANESDLTDVRVRVPRKAHLRVEMENDPAFDGSFSLLDADGEKVDLSFMLGGTTLGAQVVGIEAGESGLVQANESAVTLVLYGGEAEGGGELRRVPVRLVAGEVTVVHP